MYEGPVGDQPLTSNGSRWALRQAWEARETTLGGWCTIPSPFAVEIMATAGYDWICLDMQHGLIAYTDMVAMVQALDARNTPAIVRVPWNEPSVIMRCLDAGAAGVIVPMVNSAAEAEVAVGACRYPPLGYRSYGPTRVSLGDSGFGPEGENRRVVCAVMVETVQAATAAHEIASVSGIDAIFVGPWDLSLSLNGNVDAPAETERDVELIRSILDNCERVGVIGGIACSGTEDALRFREIGYRMLAVHSDIGMLRKAAEELAAARTGVLKLERALG